MLLMQPPAEAGVEKVPAQLWFRVGDTLAGFAPVEGFNCTSLRVLRHGAWEPVLAEPPSWEAVFVRPSFYGSPLLGPYAYSCGPYTPGSGSLTFEGRTYAIAPGKEGRAMHGLTRDHIWTVTDMQQSDDEVLLRAHLTIGGDDPDAAARLGEWPFPMTFEVTYLLRDRALVTRWTVTNDGTGNMPLGTGLHPYFPLPMRPEGSTADLVVRAQMTRRAHPMAPLNPSLQAETEGPDGYAERVDHYIAQGAEGRAASVMFERTDDPAPDLAEGAGAPLWTLADERGGVAVDIRCSAPYRYILHFVPPSRAAISPVFSTNLPDAFNQAAQGVETGMIVLAPGEVWQGWSTLSVRELEG
jgi:aldose 1-epimerase